MYPRISSPEPRARSTKDGTICGTRTRALQRMCALTARPHVCVCAIDQMWTVVNRARHAPARWRLVSVAIVRGRGRGHDRRRDRGRDRCGRSSRCPSDGPAGRSGLLDHRPARWTGPDETAGQRDGEHRDHEGVLHASEASGSRRYEGTAYVGRTASCAGAHRRPRPRAAREPRGERIDDSDPRRAQAGRGAVARVTAGARRATARGMPCTSPDPRRVRGPRPPSAPSGAALDRGPSRRLPCPPPRARRRCTHC